MGRMGINRGYDALNFSSQQRVTPTRHWYASVGVLYSLGIALGLQGRAIALPPQPTDCPSRPILERLKKHKVRPQETLAQIANRYGLVSATIMGMNPTTRNGQVTPGQTLAIPPYNGILVTLNAGQTLQTTAQTYRVKPDLLFEVNGCQRNPKTVFVPGVNWSPIDPAGSTPQATQSIAKVDPFLQQDRYPLPLPSTVIRGYGWQPNGPQNKIVFASGVDLAASPGTPVYAVADGTVAFVGKQNPWGNMVVLNHARGRQTRYGYLGPSLLKVGQQVRRGQRIATVGATASQSLRFELRYRSTLGWVAQDPQPYLQAISGSKQKPL
jgi:murein DD-endopeptidase MepM/ murein hydrolase activator NlpD